LIDQHRCVAAVDDEIIGGLGAVHVELVLETRAAAALDAHAKHGTGRLPPQNLANPARSPFSDGNVVHPQTIIAR
jgi:hypothetical protein